MAVLGVRCTYTNNEVRGCAFWARGVDPSEESWPTPTLKGVLLKRTSLRVRPPERGSETRNSVGGWGLGRQREASPTSMEQQEQSGSRAQGEEDISM